MARRVPAYKEITPEGMLMFSDAPNPEQFLDENAPKHFTSSTDMSAAIINAARFNALRFERNPSIGNPEYDLTLFPEQAPCLEEFAIEYTPPSVPDGLTLVVFGLEDGVPRLPMVQSESDPSTWKYGGFVQLPEDVPDITIVIESDVHGDIDSLSLQGSDIAKAYSDGGRTITGNAETDDDLIRRLSMKVGFVLTRRTFCVKGTMRSITMSISLTNTATKLLAEHRLTRDVKAINDAIDTANQALALVHMDVDDEYRSASAVLCAQAAGIPATKLLGEAYSARFERLGEMSDIEHAIRLLEETIDIIKASHTIRDDGAQTVVPNYYLLRLGLDTTILLPTAVHNLGVAFSRKFHQTGDPKDIDRAVELQREAMALRSTKSGDGDATESEADSVGGISSDSLGSTLLARFGRSWNIADVDEAIERQRTALAKNALLASKVQDDESGPLMDGRASIEAELGAALMQRFKRTGSLSELEEGLDHLKKAVELAQRPGSALTSIGLLEIVVLLSVAYMRRFERLGKLVDINDAISAQQLTLKLAPEDFPKRFTLLSNLALSLHNRYYHTRDQESLSESIETFYLAIEATPEGHPTLPLTFNNIASALQGLYAHSREDSHINDAILFQERAIKLSPDGHHDFAMLYDNLGSLYQVRFMGTGDVETIERAIDCHRRALEYTTPDTPNYTIITTALAESLRLRFGATKRESDLHESIELAEMALDLIPPGHSAHATHLRAVGEGYVALHSVSNDPADIHKALTHLAAASKCQTATPLRRLASTRRWMSQILLVRDMEQATESQDVLMSLLALVAGMEQTVERRYDLLANLSLEVLTASTFAVSSGNLEKAVEWLEQGRGLVWSQLNSLRSPLDGLRLVDPDLAARFEQASQKLERATQISSTRRPEGLMVPGQDTVDLEEKMSLHEQAATHVRLAKEREDLLATIRTTVPGFEDFLRPPPAKDYMDHLPEDGPVVIINMHPLRCDAIALVAGLDEPIHIPIPKFGWDQAVLLREELKRSLSDYGMRSRESRSNSLGTGGDADVESVAAPDGDSDSSPSSRGIRPRNWQQKQVDNMPDIERILRLLWTDLVKPIVDALALTPSSDQPTRIWWCPTGPLTSLPIHAAGIYRGGDAVSLLDYASSSYIPTVSSLNDRVKRTASPSPSNGVLAVSQPKYPGLPTIPGTTREVNQLAQLLEDFDIPLDRLDDEEATAAAALKGMEEHSFVHLACHASQRHESPLKSGFYLHGGVLELSSIIKSNLKNAELAFLSACQTSMGTEELSEEVVHLAAGMLSAGYKGVIATMWSIQDEYAPEVANDVYRGLLERGGEGEGDDGKRVDGSKAAHALRDAVRQLRARHGDSERILLSWVPYVHFGL